MKKEVFTLFFCCFKITSRCLFFDNRFSVWGIFLWVWKKVQHIPMLHGLWGSGNADNPNYTWKKFLPLLKDKGYETIIPVDYTDENDYSFYDSEIKKKLDTAIDDVLKKLRDEKIVAQKVDVIAHSMGGLVVRAYCADDLYADKCKKHIRKFITIDTPHLGTPLADWIFLHEKDQDLFYEQPPMKKFLEKLKADWLALPEKDRNSRPEPTEESFREDCDDGIRRFVDGGKFVFIKKIDPHPVQNGAVKDLASGNVLPSVVSSGGWLNLSYWSPVHMVAGHLPTVLPDFLAMAVGVMSPEMWYLQSQVAEPCGLSREVVFGHGGDQNSDGLVGEGSQLGTVGNNVNNTHVESADHMSVLGKKRVVDLITDLLDGGMERFYGGE